MQEDLLAMDVTQLRNGLMAGDFKSIDLFNFYGARTQKYGKSLGYATEELF